MNCIFEQPIIQQPPLANFYFHFFIQATFLGAFSCDYKMTWCGVMTWLWTASLANKPGHATRGVSELKLKSITFSRTNHVTDKEEINIYQLLILLRPSDFYTSNNKSNSVSHIFTNCGVVLVQIATKCLAIDLHPVDGWYSIFFFFFFVARM